MSTGGNSNDGLAIIELVLRDREFTQRLSAAVARFTAAANQMQQAAMDATVIESRSLSSVVSSAIAAASAISGAMGRVGGVVASAISNTIGSLTSIAGAVMGAVSSVVGGIFQFVGSVASAAAGVVSSAVRAVAGAVYSVFQAVAGSITRIFEYALGSLLADGIRAAVAAMKSFVDQGLAANAALEKTMASFEIMLGSAAKANKLLKEMQTFAANTPFEMPQLTSAATALLSTRKILEKDLIPTMAKLGDAAAGSSDGFASLPRIVRAVTQMLGKGKVTGEEMMQLAEAGIPAWDALAQKMGKSTAELQKLSSTGKLGSKEVLILIDALGDRFKGMADKQSKTYEGLMSTISDNTRLALQKITVPIFEMQKKAAEAMVKIMNSKEFAAAVDFAAGAVRTFSGIIQGATNDVIAFFGGTGGFASAIPTLKAIYNDVVAIAQNLRAMLIPALSQVSSAMSAAFGGVSTGGILAAVKSMSAAIVVMTADWGLMWDYVGLKAQETIQWFSEFFTHHITVTIPAAWSMLLDLMARSFRPVADTIQSLLVAAFRTAFDQMYYFAIQSFTKIISKISGMTTSLAGMFDLAKFIQNPASALGEFAAKATGFAATESGAATAEMIRGMGTDRFADARNRMSTLGPLISGIASNAFAGLPGIAAFTPSAGQQAMGANSNAALGAMQSRAAQNAQGRQANQTWQTMVGVGKLLAGAGLNQVAGFFAPAGPAAVADDKAEQKKKKVDFVGVSEMGKRLQSALTSDKDKAMLNAANKGANAAAQNVGVAQQIFKVLQEANVILGALNVGAAP